MTDHTPSAVEAEAKDADHLTIDWDGVAVTLPAKLDDWEIETLEAFEQGKAATAVRGVLGKKYDATMAAFKEHHGRTAKVRDLETFMEAFAVAYGFSDPGE